MTKKKQNQPNSPQRLSPLPPHPDMKGCASSVWSTPTEQTEIRTCTW